MFTASQNNPTKHHYKKLTLGHPLCSNEIPTHSKNGSPVNPAEFPPQP
jgi:hypothetical protein